MEKYNPRLKALVLEVVNNQIREMPNVKACYDTLRERFGDKRARELIGSVAIGEIYEVMKYGREFDEVKYDSELKKLLETSK